MNKPWVFYKDIEGTAAAPGVVRKVLACSDTTMCVENAFEESAVGARHRHPHAQITYVASGRFRFSIGDEAREVATGDSLCIQGGLMHGCECLERGALVDFFTPVREDFA